jgi:deoxyribodipyrimidine photo-lyase
MSNKTKLKRKNDDSSSEVASSMSESEITKVAKIATKNDESSSSKISLLDSILKSRNQQKSVEEIKFNKKRVRVLSNNQDIDDKAEGILYWMSREQRVQDNWSLLYAQKIALKLSLPLVVGFCLSKKPFLNAPYRHYHFMLEGLKSVENVNKKPNYFFTFRQQNLIFFYIKKRNYQS